MARDLHRIICQTNELKLPQPTQPVIHDTYIHPYTEFVKLDYRRTLPLLRRYDRHFKPPFVEELLYHYERHSRLRIAYIQFLLNDDNTYLSKTEFVKLQQALKKVEIVLTIILNYKEERLTDGQTRTTEEASPDQV